MTKLNNVFFSFLQQKETVCIFFNFCGLINESLVKEGNLLQTERKRKKKDE